MINYDTVNNVICYLKENRLYDSNFKLKSLDEAYPNIFTDEYPYIVNRMNELIDKRAKESKKISDIITDSSLKSAEKTVRFCEYFPFKDANNVKLEIALIEMLLARKNYKELERRNAIGFKSVIPLLVNNHNKNYLNTLGAYLGSTHIDVDNFEMNPKIMHKLYGEDKFIGNYSNERIKDEYFNIDKFDNKEDIVARYAELYTYEKIINMLKLSGNEDLIKKVIWASRIGDGFGYDILLQDKNGNEIKVEVKSTSSRNVGYGDFILSDNEYNSFKSSNNDYIVYKLIFDKYNKYKLTDIYSYKKTDPSNSKLEIKNEFTNDKCEYNYITLPINNFNAKERPKQKVLLVSKTK